MQGHSKYLAGTGHIYLRVFDAVIVISSCDADADDSTDEHGKSNQEETHHAVDGTTSGCDRTSLISALATSRSHYFLLQITCDMICSKLYMYPIMNFIPLKLIYECFNDLKELKILQVNILTKDKANEKQINKCKSTM